MSDQSSLEPLAAVQTAEFCDLFEPHARKGRSARLDRMSRNDVVIMLVRSKRELASGKGEDDSLRVLKIFTVANAEDVDQFREKYLEEYQRDPNGFCERDYSVFNFFRNYVSFESEARILGHARSYGANRIVPILGVHKLRGIPGSDLFAQKTLNAIELPYLEKYFAPPAARWREAVSDTIEILQGVHELHSLFVPISEYPGELQTKLSRNTEYLHPIHLDINPDQVMRGPDGRLVLIDFGCSRVFDEHLQRTTIPGVYTPLYSPPEQLRGIRKSELDFADYRVETLDVYPLAVMLFEGLSGLDFSERVLRMTNELREHAAVVEYRQKHFETDLESVRIGDDFEQVREPLLSWILATTEVTWEDRKEALVRLLGEGPAGWRGEWNLAIRSADWLSRKVLGRDLSIELKQDRIPQGPSWVQLCDAQGAGGRTIDLQELVAGGKAKIDGAEREVRPQDVRWFFRGQPRFEEASESRSCNYPVVWDNRFRPWWPGRYELFPTYAGLVDWSHSVVIEVVDGVSEVFLGFQNRHGEILSIEEEIVVCPEMHLELRSFVVLPSGEVRPTDAEVTRAGRVERGSRFAVSGDGSLRLQVGPHVLEYRVVELGSFEQVLASMQELHWQRSCTRSRFHQLESLYFLVDALEGVPQEFVFTLGSNLQALGHSHGFEFPSVEGLPGPGRASLDGLGKGTAYRALALNNHLALVLQHQGRLGGAEKLLVQELAEALTRSKHLEPVRGHHKLLVRNLERLRAALGQNAERERAEL